ncbi:hypothetical protein BH11CYA1_BH11CYA1_29720 [soil metagenome]
MIEVTDKNQLGNLVLQLGLLDNKDLGQAISIAQETSLPLGRVFVLSSLLTEEVLQGTLRCQSLIKQNLVDIKLARQAMDLVKTEQVTIDEALFKLGWDPESTKDTTPLGELLIEAGYVSRDQLQQALEKNRTSGLPFGRLLVFSGAVTEGLLTGALNAQILIRDGKLSKPQAVEALKEARQRQVSVEVPLKEKGFYDLPNRHCPRIGELLLFCGVISQSDLVSALELGLINKEPVGQVLMQEKLVNRKILQAALLVQTMMSDQEITITDARSVIQSVKDGITVEQALETLLTEAEEAREESTAVKSEHISLYDFLKSLGSINDAQVQDAYEIAKHNSTVLTQMLLISGTLDGKTLERAERCRKLVHEKKLSQEHANIAFDYAERADIDVTQALKELQWYQPSDGEEEEPIAPAEEDDKHEETSEEEEWDTQVRKASQYLLTNKTDAALEIWLTLLQKAEATQPEKVIECIDEIAGICSRTRNFGLAEQYYLRALKLKEKTADPNKVLLAQALSNLGKICYFQRKFQECEDYARRFIEVIADNFGPTHPDVACGWQNLASIYYAQKKYQLAKGAYLAGIRICDQGLGDRHPTTVQLNRNYASLLQKMDQLEQAGTIDASATGVITGSWRTLPKDHNDYLGTGLFDKDS